jgi:hypothetical protein
MSMCWIGEVKSSFFVGIATSRIAKHRGFRRGFGC